MQYECSSSGVLKDNSELFEVVKRPVEMIHSEDNTVEKASEVILGAELRIGTHVYTSNWVVASCRYDFLLGMPCMLPSIRRLSIENVL